MSFRPVRPAPPAAVFLTALLALAACDENPPEVIPTPVPVEEPTPAPAAGVPVTLQAGPLSVYSGRISAPGQADVFLLELAAGDRIRIDVDAEGKTPPSTDLDAFLVLHGPDGDVLATADDGTNVWSGTATAPGPLRDPYLVVTAVAAGRHTAVIQDAHGGGANDSGYDYRVAFSRVNPTTLNGGTTCGDAVALPAVASGTAAVVSVTGTVSGSSTDTCCTNTVITCVGTRVEAPDVLYTISLSTGVPVQFTRSGPSFDGAIYVTDACSASNQTVIDACKAGADGADDTDGVVYTPQVGGLHYVFVDGVSGNGGDFVLDVRQMQ